MTETNRIEYKRELTPELDIKQEVWRYKYLCAYVDDSFKFINSFIVVPQVLSSMAKTSSRWSLSTCAVVWVWSFSVLRHFLR